jgi:hypothetical protein
MKRGWYRAIIYPIRITDESKEEALKRQRPSVHFCSLLGRGRGGRGYVVGGEEGEGEEAYDYWGGGSVEEGEWVFEEGG